MEEKGNKTSGQNFTKHSTKIGLLLSCTPFKEQNYPFNNLEDLKRQTGRRKDTHLHL